MVLHLSLPFPKHLLIVPNLGGGQDWIPRGSREGGHIKQRCMPTGNCSLTSREINNDKQGMARFCRHEVTDSPVTNCI